MSKHLLGLVALSIMTMTAACGQSATATAGAPKAVQASEGDVSHVVSGMQDDLKSCVDRGLALDPTLRGGFVAELKIGPAGGVESVDAQDVVGLNRTVIVCLTKRMQSARFPAPGAKGATVRIPLHFEA